MEAHPHTGMDDTGNGGGSSGTVSKDEIKDGHTGLPVVIENGTGAFVARGPLDKPADPPPTIVSAASPPGMSAVRARMWSSFQKVAVVILVIIFVHVTFGAAWTGGTERSDMSVEDVSYPNLVLGAAIAMLLVVWLLYSLIPQEGDLRTN